MQHCVTCPDTDEIIISYMNCFDIYSLSQVNKHYHYHLPTHEYKFPSYRKRTVDFEFISLWCLKVTIALNRQLNDETIDCLINAKSLSLANCANVTAAGVKKLSQLYHLSIAASPTWSLNDEAFAAFTRITSLHIRNNGNITDSLLQVLPQTLKHLTLCACPLITGRYLDTMLNLETLSLKDNSQINGDQVGLLAKVRKVNLSGTIFKDGNMYIFPAVKEMYLNNNSSITNAGLRHLSAVEKLYMVDCSRLTDEGLKYLKNISFLDITSCSISDVGLQSIASTLRHLIMNDCHKITDAGLMNLKQLAIVECRYGVTITEECIRQLKEKSVLVR
jgi:hypothetical protein